MLSLGDRRWPLFAYDAQCAGIGLCRRVTGEFQRLAYSHKDASAYRNSNKKSDYCPSHQYDCCPS